MSRSGLGLHNRIHFAIFFIKLCLTQPKSKSLLVFLPLSVISSFIKSLDWSCHSMSHIFPEMGRQLVWLLTIPSQTPQIQSDSNKPNLNSTPSESDKSLTYHNLTSLNLFQPIGTIQIELISNSAKLFYAKPYPSQIKLNPNKGWYNSVCVISDHMHNTFIKWKNKCNWLLTIQNQIINSWKLSNLTLIKED